MNRPRYCVFHEKVFLEAPYLGRLIWDVVSGTPYLGRFLARDENHLPERSPGFHQFVSPRRFR